MFETLAARATLRLSLAAFAVAAVAAVWHVLAMQVPGSMLYLGMLSGPVGNLREAAFTLGVLHFLAALALPRAYPARTPLVLVALLYAGTLGVLGASFYGACTGLHGEQFYDLRPDARPLFVTKHASYALTCLALGWLGRRTLSPARP